MNIESSTRMLGSVSVFKLCALPLMLILFPIGGVEFASAATLPPYIPTATPTATSTLFTNGATSISPGRVAVDKAGNVFYVGHVSGLPSTLYEIPASSPVVAVSTPTPLITGLGQTNSNSAFVDAAGTLWVSNGNGLGAALIEIPASNGIPNIAAITGSSNYNSSGLSLINVSNACTAAPTTPCVWTAGAIGFILTSLQVGDVYSDGGGNVYLVDVSDNVSAGAYNRVIKFNTSAPGTYSVLVDNLASNAYAQVTVAGDGKVYYCDSVTGHPGGGLVSQVNSSALTTVGNLASTALTLASTAVEVSAATGITTDPWGNLIISGATQISEIPLENGTLAFADEFTPLVAVTGVNSPMYTNNAIYGGTFDVHGSYYYASATNIMQTQMGGYNFGKINVGTEVTTAAPYLNITWGVPSYLITSALSPTASPSGLSAANAAYLQSFPYSGNKNYSGGTPYGYGQFGGATGQYVQMYFQPVHTGLLRGAFTPQGYPSALGPASAGGNGLLTSTVTNAAYTVNLQGVGVGPQPMFLPGISSKAIALPQLYTTSSHTTLATSFTPQGVAVDTYGDIFVADSANGTLDIECLATTASAAGSGLNFCQANGAGYTYEVTGTTFTAPVGVVLDGANSAYILDSAPSAATVTRFSFNLMGTPFVVVPSGTSVAGTAMSGPKGIAIDGYSNLYIADTGNNRIIQAHQYNAAYSQNIVYVSSTATFGGTKLSGPIGMGLDASGNLFIADTGNSRIVEYSATGVTSVVSTIGVTLVAPTGVKVLPSGALVVTDSSKGLILVANGAGSVLSTGSITLTKPQALSLDLAGNIYVADSTGSQIVELNVNSPAAMTSFPNTLRGASSPKTSLVYNSGNATLTFSAVPVILDNSIVSSNDFVLDSSNGCAGTTSVTAAGNCGLVVDFAPSATADLANPTTGTVTLADNLQSYTVASGIGSFGTTGSTQKISMSGQATVNATLQPITFTTATTSVTWSLSIPPITLSATGGGSGNAVVFSILSGGGTLSGANNSTLTLSGVGATVIAANQAGGVLAGINYAAAFQTTQTITVNPIGPVATPAFSVAPGTYTSTQNVSVTDPMPGAKIYYTIDGTTPTTSSTLYTGTITVATTTTVNALAVATGYSNSVVASAIYTIAVPTPTFSVASGTYTSTQTVSISDTIAGTAIYFTLDGTTPTPSSTAYTRALTVGSTATLQAIAVKSGFSNSVVALATYTLVPDFTITLGNTTSPAKQSITVVNGHADFEPIAITPLSGFSSGVTISCSGLPVNYSCNYSVPTATPSWPTIVVNKITMLDPTASSGTAATSTIFMEPNGIALAKHPGSSSFLPTATLAAVLCLFGFRKRNRLLMVVLLVMSTVGSVMLTGCSSSAVQPNATSSTSIITVTGTSGTTVHSVTFTLVVTNM